MIPNDSGWLLLLAAMLAAMGGGLWLLLGRHRWPTRLAGLLLLGAAVFGFAVLNTAWHYERIFDARAPEPNAAPLEPPPRAARDTPQR